MRPRKSFSLTLAMTHPVLGGCLLICDIRGISVRELAVYRERNVNEHVCSSFHTIITVVTCFLFKSPVIWLRTTGRTVIVTFQVHVRLARTSWFLSAQWPQNIPYDKSQRIAFIRSESTTNSIELINRWTDIWCMIMKHEQWKEIN